MASRIARFFFNTEKLAEANAKYKARIAEINENNETVKAAIAQKRVENKRVLHEQLAKNNAEFKEKWNGRTDS
jgi:hypothetical protein